MGAMGATGRSHRGQFRDCQPPELSCSDGDFDPNDQAICLTIQLSYDDNPKSLFCQPGQVATRTIFTKLRPWLHGIPSASFRS